MEGRGLREQDQKGEGARGKGEWVRESNERGQRKGKGQLIDSNLFFPCKVWLQ